MRVVGCVPVPNAKPGSRRITRCACAGGSCQVGTIQKSGVMSTGANCDCVSRTQSWSCSGASASTVQPSKKSCTANSACASSAASSVANKATTLLRCQPAWGGGMPGSPKSACSASVCASASSTDTLSASSASNASLKVSTPVLRAQQAQFMHVQVSRKKAPGMGTCFTQRWRCDSHSSR
jgi:hypothetical protein